jgi:hypothetical protein
MLFPPDLDCWDLYSEKVTDGSLAVRCVLSNHDDAVPRKHARSIKVLRPSYELLLSRLWVFLRGG